MSVCGHYDWGDVSAIGIDKPVGGTMALPPTDTGNRGQLLYRRQSLPNDKSISASYRVSRLASPVLQDANPSSISSPFNYGPNVIYRGSRDRPPEPRRNPYSRPISASGDAPPSVVKPEGRRTKRLISPLPNQCAFLRPVPRHRAATVRTHVPPATPTLPNHVPPASQLSAPQPTSISQPRGLSNGLEPPATTVSLSRNDPRNLHLSKLNESVAERRTVNRDVRDSSVLKNITNRNNYSVNYNGVTRQQTTPNRLVVDGRMADSSVVGVARQRATQETNGQSLPSIGVTSRGNGNIGEGTGVKGEIHRADHHGDTDAESSDDDVTATSSDESPSPLNENVAEKKFNENQKEKSSATPSELSKSKVTAMLAKSVATRLLRNESDDSVAREESLATGEPTQEEPTPEWNSEGEECFSEDYLDDSESDSGSETTAFCRQIRRRMSDLPSRTVSRPTSAYKVPTTTQPGLRRSLFPKHPPTINFGVEGEKIEQLPWDIRKLLKWRLTTITPHVVRDTFYRVGFRLSKKPNDWLGCWGKHMKSEAFRAVGPHQKVNHFPGTFQIGRKDRLFRNLSKLQAQHGAKHFAFFPMSFVLPSDWRQLKRAWDENSHRQKWIIKPPASARGIGIRVIHKWSQIPRKRPVIVQHYLSRPFLINNSKFDLRIYVFVTCYDPLRVYIFDDGLVRFATTKYSHSTKNLSNRFMHLTNYSVNKKNADYSQNTDENVCVGHKWSLKAFWTYLGELGVDSTKLWAQIKDVVVKTMIASEPYVNSLVKSNVKWHRSCHELFGFDIMLDENLKPWILEVNISPSLHSTARIDQVIKGQMIKDVMNLAGFQVPFPEEVGSPSNPKQTNLVPHMELGTQLRESQLTPDDRCKHVFYIQRHLDEQCRATILDSLTSDDVRVLTETEDEFSRRGHFEILFPTLESARQYSQFFEQPRYYNMLVSQWLQRYRGNRQESRGIALLQAYCEQGFHLANESATKWKQPVLRNQYAVTSGPSTNRKQRDGGSTR